MGKASRSKGKRGEREFEQLIVAHSISDYLREQDGRTQGADFRIGSFCVDVKRREQVAIRQWSREIEARTAHPLMPCIAYRTNGEDWRVSMKAGDWLETVAFTEGFR